MGKMWELTRLCRWNMSDAVKDCLKSEEIIDILEDDGFLFDYVADNDGAEVAKILIKYFEDHMLAGDPESIEYQSNMCRLKDVITDLASRNKLSDEMLASVGKYIRPEGDSDDDEFGDFDDDILATNSEENFHQISGDVLLVEHAY